MDLSINLADIVIFQKIWHACPSESDTFKAVDIKEHTPALSDNGAIVRKAEAKCAYDLWA